MISSGRVRYKSLMLISLTFLWSTWHWSLSDSILQKMNYCHHIMAGFTLITGGKCCLHLRNVTIGNHAPSLKCYWQKSAKDVCSGKDSFSFPTTNTNQAKKKRIWGPFETKCATISASRYISPAVFPWISQGFLREHSESWPNSWELPLNLTFCNCF